MSQFKREDRLVGIRFWVQFYSMRIPRFEVFEYVGVQLDTGIYYFQSRTERSYYIGRSFYQLNTKNFRPFCLDFAHMKPFLKEEK